MRTAKAGADAIELYGNMQQMSAISSTNHHQKSPPSLLPALPGNPSIAVRFPLCPSRKEEEEEEEEDVKKEHKDETDMRRLHSMAGQPSAIGDQEPSSHTLRGGNEEEEEEGKKGEEQEQGGGERGSGKGGGGMR